MNKFHSVLKEIRQGKFSPIYVVYGEELYFSDKIIKALEENVIDKAAKDFNYTLLYGSRELKAVEIEPLVRAYPMMSPKRLIIIKDAHKIAENELASLLPIFSNPPKTSVLALIFNQAKLPDRRKKWVKTLLQNATVIEAKKIRDYEVKKWVKIFASEMKLQLSEQAAEVLADMLGPNLNIIENELQKLKLFCYNKPQQVIDEDLILSFANVGKEHSVFSLTDSLGEKNFGKALNVLSALLEDNTNPAVRILYHIFNFYSRIAILKEARCASKEEAAKLLNIHPYAAEKYLKASRLYDYTQVVYNLNRLLEADRQLKGIQPSVMNEKHHIKMLLKELLT